MKRSLFGTVILVGFIMAINLAWISLVVWVVVKLLRFLGVL